MRRFPSMISRLVLMTALSWAMLCSPAWAAPSIDDLSESQRDALVQKLDRARIFFEEGLFKRALKEFNEAYTIYPHPDVNYRIAECEARLGMHKQAIEHYKEVLAQTDDAQDKAQLQEKIKAQEEKLGPDPVRVKIASAPQGASVQVAGVPQGTTPSTFTLAPGKYTLTLSKEGFISRRRAFSVARDTPLELNMTLEPLSPEEESAPIPTASWVLGGVGLASAVASGVFYGLYLNTSSDIEELDAQRDKIRRPTNYDDIVSARNTQGTLALVTGGVAVASLTGAVVYWLIQEPQDQERSQLSGWFTADAAGVSVHSSF